MSKIGLPVLMVSILAVGLMGIFYGNPINIAYNLLTAQVIPSGNFTVTFDGQVGQVAGGDVYATKLLNPRPMTSDEMSQLSFQITKTVNVNAPIIRVVDGGKLGTIYTLSLNNPSNYYEQYSINFTSLPGGIDHCWSNNFRVTNSSALKFTISCVDKYIYADTGNPADYVPPIDNPVTTQESSIASLSYQSLPLDLTGTKEEIISVKSLSLGTKKYLLALTNIPSIYNSSYPFELKVAGSSFLYVFDASNPYNPVLLKKNNISGMPTTLFTSNGYPYIVTFVNTYGLQYTSATFYSLASSGQLTLVKDYKFNPRIDWQYLFTGAGKSYAVAASVDASSTPILNFYDITNPNSAPQKVGSTFVDVRSYGFPSRFKYLGVSNIFGTDTNYAPHLRRGYTYFQSFDDNLSSQAWSAFVIEGKQYLTVPVYEFYHALRNNGGQDLAVFDVTDPKNPQKVFIKDDESLLFGSESKILGLNGVLSSPLEQVIIDPINKKIASLYQTKSSELIPPNATYSYDMAKKITSNGLLDIGLGIFSFDSNFVKPVSQTDELAPYRANPTLTEVGNSLICEQRGMGLGGYEDAFCGTNSSYKGVNADIRSFLNGLAYHATYVLDHQNNKTFKENRLSFTGSGQPFSWISDPNNQMTEYQNHLTSNSYLSSNPASENAILVQTDSKNFAVIKYDSKHIDVVKASFAFDIPMGTVGSINYSSTLSTPSTPSAQSTSSTPTIPTTSPFSFNSLINIFRRILGK
jgi:hypothetical protein